MKTFRLKRLFHPKSGRCFDVAVDHGFFNEHAFLGGIENLEPAARTLVAAEPDAIRLTVGQAPLLQSNPGPPQTLARAAHGCRLLRAGKDPLAEKPFGIDLTAARVIAEAARASGRFVRCSSEFPFLPGAQRAYAFARDGHFGTLLGAYEQAPRRRRS